MNIEIPKEPLKLIDEGWRSNSLSTDGQTLVQFLRLILGDRLVPSDDEIVKLLNERDDT